MFTCLMVMQGSVLFLLWSAFLFSLDILQWDPKYRIKVRVICARAYHALFMVRHCHCHFLK